MVDFGANKVFGANFQIAISQEPLGVWSWSFNISRIPTHKAKMKKSSGKAVMPWMIWYGIALLQWSHLVANNWFLPCHRNHGIVAKLSYIFPWLIFSKRKSIFCVVVETFCESMLPQISEPLEVLTWDAEGEVFLGGREIQYVQWGCHY